VMLTMIIVVCLSTVTSVGTKANSKFNSVASALGS
jgi:hypothetical protein